MRTFRLMWQDENTGTGQCPAIYTTDDAFVIQGKTTDTPDTVFIVDNVIDRLPTRDRAAIGHALAADVGGYLATGDPVLDTGERSQLYELGDDETAVVVATRQGIGL